MGGQGIACEKHIYPSRSDDGFEVVAGACMDDSRAAHKEDFLSLLPCLFHCVHDGGDDTFFRALGGDVASHKAKYIVRFTSLDGSNAHTGIANDDKLPFTHMMHRGTTRSGLTLFIFDDNGAVHLDELHGEPLVAYSHVGFEVGCGIEAFGKHTVFWSRHQAGLSGCALCAMLAGGVENALQRFIIWGADLYLCVTRIGACRAHLKA